MATRQRTRASRKPSSANTTAGAGEQVTPASTEASTRESAVLHAAFDPQPFDGADDTTSDTADTPKATFVGEQLVYKDRYQLISEAAYLRAEQRGFSPGYELDDWLAAERDIDAQFSSDANAGSDTSATPK